MTFAFTSRSGSPGHGTAAAPSLPQSIGPHRTRALLPSQPSAIPAAMQVAPAGSALEREADATAAQATGAAPRSPAASSATESFDAPAIVQEGLGSPGRQLDSSTRNLMESRLGSDLSSVRIHTGPQAARTAEGVHARAYTVGQDIFFGAGKYDPHTREGRRLLAHELTHTVQQSGGSKSKGLSKAAPSIQRDPIPQSKPAAQGTTTDTDTKKPTTDQVSVTVPPSLLTQYRLTPPSLLTPPQPPSFFSPGTYSLGGSGSRSTSLTPPAGLTKPTLPLPSQYTPSAPLPPVSQPNQALTPGPGGSSGTPGVSPKAPDRLSFHDFGRLSIGARIGFPDLSQEVKPGDPPSALQESLKKGQILNFMLTGQPPPEYSIDPAKLVGALWGIFSTQISPSTAAKIAAGMSSKPKGSGLTYQLDATILFGSSGGKTGGGGGATLTVNF